MNSILLVALSLFIVSGYSHWVVSYEKARIENVEQSRQLMAILSTRSAAIRFQEANATFSGAIAPASLSPYTMTGVSNVSNINGTSWYAIIENGNLYIVVRPPFDNSLISAMSEALQGPELIGIKQPGSSHIKSYNFTNRTSGHNSVLIAVPSAIEVGALVVIGK